MLKSCCIAFFFMFLSSCESGIKSSNAKKEGLFSDALPKKVTFSLKKEKRVSSKHKFFVYSVSLGDFAVIRKHLESLGYAKFKYSRNGADLHYQHPEADEMNAPLIYSSYQKDDRVRYSVDYFPERETLVLEYFNSGR